MQIPFLPISLFKTGKVSCEIEHEAVFESSGTTGKQTSKHYVHDLSLYRESIDKGFHYFFGSSSNKAFLLLLPGYLERENSSLVYMMNYLMRGSKISGSNFYLYDHKEMYHAMEQLEKRKEKYLLFGVTYALLDFMEYFKELGGEINSGIVFETGGMKGKRKELPKDELHRILRSGFGVDTIYSEYGMTELLSQAYLMGDNHFHCPPWMKVIGREVNDPLQLRKEGRSMGLNIIDFANLCSCSFVATEDAGNLYEDGSFEVNGRLDHTLARGCNLLL